MTNKTKNKFLHRIQHLPLACSGMALGISGVASLIDVMLQKYVNIEKTNLWIGSAILLPIAFLLIILLMIKYASYRRILKFELKDPLFSSLIPTSTMVLMCLAGFIAGWDKGSNYIAVNQVIGAIIMCAAILGQLIIFVFFIKNVLIKHSWHHNPMYGSWFVPSVGIATACTFANRFNQAILPDEFFQAIWFFAFITYVIMFFPVTYSILFKTKVPDDKLASTGVYFAPANLTLASFLQTFSLNDRAWEIYANAQQFIIVMSVLLWAMGVTMYIILLIFAFKIIFTTKFSFLFAALTFPLSIGSMGTEYMYLFLKQQTLKLSESFVDILTQMTWILSMIFMGIVFITISYIFIRFLIGICKILFTNKYDEEIHHIYLPNNEIMNDKKQPNLH